MPLSPPRNSAISDGRYSLAADEVGFAVIDHENADERRPVETLSGGETFLASLGLAMALSRSLTDIAGASVGSKLEAMFIDEGFGTLDAETLNVVIDALERLKETNRLVGIITHLQALADYAAHPATIARRGVSRRDQEPARPTDSVADSQGDPGSHSE